jgi:FkbH-like protein
VPWSGTERALTSAVPFDSGKGNAMTDDRERTELLESYLKADAPSRRQVFAGFLRAIKSLAEEAGPEGARPWAERAVSPLLDYSSLMKLARYVPARKPAEGAGKPVRLAILGGPTTTQLRQFIDVFLASEGIAALIYEGDYGLFRQEILAPGSGLDSFQPQIIFLANGARDVTRFPSIDMDEEAVAQLAAEELDDWSLLWQTANARWNATLIQNNFECAPGSVMGHYGLRHPAARENYLERLNRMMAERAPAFVVLHDLHGLAAEMGARSWFDPRFYLEFKMPCGAECLVSYAHSACSLLRAVLGKSKKVLVLDLDNTLWGGVIGDLGPGGISLGQGSGEGEAFLAFQRYVKELARRGILLAVCSKNDDANAREPFEKRSDMILRMSDFSCFIANWENKADNLRTIAEALELKLDSFVFVDDNPAERAIVRQFVPEVSVPDMPEDPAGYVHALALHRFFETIAFTREDTSRSRYYAENAQRKELAARSTDLNSFLTSLKMRMKVESVNEMNLERVTQLVNKSNQFNLTTRRFTPAQMREISKSPDWLTLSFSLSDNLGDNGLIGVILLQKREEAIMIDTWVMSCRVLQRGVEHFARNELVGLARGEGRRRLLGTYIPTPKNGMVKDHFARLGFDHAGSDGECTLWSLDVDSLVGPLDHFIEREVTRE